MKFGLVVAGLLGISLSVSAAATTLKLSPDIELMVVDGKQMTGSLLKGADSLELNDGQHQLLFKVTKSVRKEPRSQMLYTSSAQLVVFNSQNVSAVTIELPRIENEQDAQRFDKAPNYKILGNHGKPLAIKHDVLPLTTSPNGNDLEKIVADYNAQNRQASVPALAHLSASVISATQGSPAVIPLNGDNVAEEMLQYWFLRADPETQKRFIAWAGQSRNR
ncbi:UPF0319 protein YccT precursor [Serratia fonticola AU-P3(3)]|nr:UPF0319 protein YccT precursor [Serratia fonticola AU-P3(3)]